MGENEIQGFCHRSFDIRVVKISHKFVFVKLRKVIPIKKSKLFKVKSQWDKEKC